MSSVAVPSQTPAVAAASANRRWMFWLIPVLGLLLGAGYLVMSVASSRVAAGIGINGGQFYAVLPTDMEVKVRQKGELQAINNIDIVCQVEGQTVITTIVKEGSMVKKGQVLATLDSSAIKQKIEDATLDIQKAEADLSNSKELRAIQESQNSANLEAAQVALDASKLDLSAYVEGTYPQSLQNAQTTLEKAKITLKTKQENFAQTQNLFNKNFVTATDVKNAEIDMSDAANAVQQAETALKVLVQYTHPKDLADKKAAVSQAEQKLIRTQRENAANMTQKNVDVNSKEQALGLLKRRMEHLQDQLAACTITAPADGLVVYSSSGDRERSQNPIQEGAQVRERQPLLRLPDTSSMKAIVRVQEAQVPKLREGQPAIVRITGINRPISATVSKISVLSDNSQRWWNPDLKEYPVDLYLDQTPPNLKPGLDVDADILIARAPNVLTVKLGSLYAAGDDTYVFVRDGDRVRPQKVKIGMVNETMAEVKTGLTSGQQVLMLGAGQGRELLEQSGIKVEPTTRPSDFQNGPKRGGDRGRREQQPDPSRRQNEPAGPPAGAAPPPQPLPGSKSK